MTPRTRITRWLNENIDLVPVVLVFTFFLVIVVAECRAAEPDLIHACRAQMLMYMASHGQSYVFPRCRQMAGLPTIEEAQELRAIYSQRRAAAAMQKAVTAAAVSIASAAAIPPPPNCPGWVPPAPYVPCWTHLPATPPAACGMPSASTVPPVCPPKPANLPWNCCDCPNPAPSVAVGPCWTAVPSIAPAPCGQPAAPIPVCPPNPVKMIAALLGSAFSSIWDSTPIDPEYFVLAARDANRPLLTRQRIPPSMITQSDRDMAGVYAKYPGYEDFTHHVDWYILYRRRSEWPGAPDRWGDLVVFLAEMELADAGANCSVNHAFVMYGGTRWAPDTPTRLICWRKQQ